MLTHFNRWCSASSVESYDDLCDLIVLEQFKASLPAQLATYITEKKVTTAAAVLADEYVLTSGGPLSALTCCDNARVLSRSKKTIAVNLLSKLGWELGLYRISTKEVLTHGSGSAGGQREGQWRESFRFRANRPPVAHDVSQAAVRHVPGTDGKFDPGRTWHAFRNRGHWKGECPIRKAGQKSANTSVYAKPVGLVTSVLHTDMSESVHPPGTVSSKHVDELYTPFVSNGFVSLDGQGKVRVKILRDSGANQSLILSSVLPFSAHTATGGKAPVLGVGMVTLWVPVHRVHLDSDLVCGEVDIAIRPELPIQGVDVILGNDLAGSKIWEKGPPLVYVGSVLQVPKEPEGCAKESPEVFSSCAVTRAKSKVLSEQSELSEQGQSFQAGVSEGQGLCKFFFHSFACVF
ncbi:hypothetical protein N1851_028415 [Merluccius polli]|uniref:Peptidase A2 domain-containing protein n=1 Tax=Merluccius polli TaxID=89951 RepID=A0AA47NSM1_MERPO|nr:hypothetical protein N1851_028415 [Merluccius polli]